MNRRILRLPPLVATHEDAYMKALIRDPQFYEEKSKERVYYYCIDSLGRLFVEDMNPKNVTTCLKSPKFLRFFFSQLRWSETEQERWEKADAGEIELEPGGDGGFSEYPFFSPCGKEHNHVMAMDSPLVASELKENDTKLQLGAQVPLTFPLDLDRIVGANGRVYALIDHKRLGNDFPVLLSSPLLLSLASDEAFDLDEDGSGEIKLQEAWRTIEPATRLAGVRNDPERS